MKFQNAIRNAAALAVTLVWFGTLGCGRHAYDNPIAKATEQPDKVLFDKAIVDLEHNRFEVARITLNALINTYDSSEYLAKAKLAIADSWYREGDSRGLAQAEAEYKDFILFYPTMEEAAEAQEKVCKIHYSQLDKADRDPLHSIRAEEECRAVLTQFPNSKFAPEAEQLLRNVQENLAGAEYKVGKFYETKGSFFPAANRLQTLVEQYPLFSQADEALWSAATAYNRLGDRWEKQEVTQLSKLLREYPLSMHADAAKTRLKALNVAPPEVDPVAYARMKYELENRASIGLWSKFWGTFAGSPNLATSAKSGAPQMEGLRPSIPANVPPVAAGTAGTSGDVTVSNASDSTALDTNPDARSTTAPDAAAPAPPQK